MGQRKKARAYIDFVEEVASCILGDDRVYVFEDQETRRHIPSSLENASDRICARRRFDIETWDR